MGLKFDIQVDVPLDPIIEAASRAEHILAIQVAKDTQPYVPTSGNSAGLVNKTQVREGTIIYPGPYARFLYRGKVMVDPVTHAAGFLTEDGWKSRRGVKKIETDRPLNIINGQSHWFEASKAANLEKWLKAAERAMKHELG